MRLSIILLVLLIGGCTVNKVPAPTGGSRSDGTVTMSYEKGSMETAVVDWSAAQAEALKRCQAWGYDQTEPFGGQTSQCQSSGMYGCNREIISITYQCIKTTPID